MADVTYSRPGPREQLPPLPSDEVVIGLAVGSPQENPLPPLPSENFDCCYYPPATAFSHRTKNEERTIKTKSARWKTLGGLFGRKDLLIRSPQTQPLYQLDRKTKQRQSTRKSFSDPPKGRGCTLQKRRRACTNQAKRTELTGLGKRSRSTKGSALLRKDSSPKQGYRRKMIEEVKKDWPRSQNVPSPRMTVSNSLPRIPPRERSAQVHNSWPLLLQVEIPNVELERYSVMFGHVLQSLQLKPHSPLLVQRQSQSVELQPVPTLEHKVPKADELSKPVRRNHTPSPIPKFPSFSLFPASAPLSNRNLTAKPLAGPSPLSRSTTAPDSTLSAPRPTLKTSKSLDPDQLMTVTHSSEDKPPGKSGDHHHDKSSSGTSCLSMNIPEEASFSEGPDLSSETAPPTPIKNGKNTFLERAFPARTSSLKAPKAPQTSPHAHGANASISSVAEISIARQVSFSERRRQLLVPIVAKTARLPMQAQLVSTQSASALRKSHHLVLEDA